MKFNALPINENVTNNVKRVESAVNAAVRGYEKLASLVGGGRKGPYDDNNFEFVGGAKDSLRMKHYDKSLRLLWKAEQHLPQGNFRDMTKDEKVFMSQAKQTLNKKEKVQIERFSSDEYKALINREYTQEQKQAIINILSIIGHGEAYAWMVSAEVLTDCKSTGGRAALTMQVLEEAKHFVVLRELMLAWDCEIPRFTVWEYIVLERTLKSKGMEKFFGMNVVVENVAMGIFGMLGELPGLEILKMFHLDESRHTALPYNYFDEMPMTWWEKNSPLAQFRRLMMVLPAVPMMASLEKDMAILGVDSLEFGGAMLRKIAHMKDRVGFNTFIPSSVLKEAVNDAFNLYASYSRPGHTTRRFVEADTVMGEDMQAIEKELFDLYSTGKKVTELASRKILDWRKAA